MAKLTDEKIMLALSDSACQVPDKKPKPKIGYCADYDGRGINCSTIAAFLIDYRERMPIEGRR